MDPRDFGAKCDSCPLNGKIPIFSTHRPKNPLLVIISESPGPHDLPEDGVLSGASGKRLALTTEKFGLPISACFKTNAVLCNMPFDLNPKDTALAITACKPRLEAELVGLEVTPKLVLGGSALQSLFGHKAINNWAGGPLTTGKDYVIPTLHPVSLFKTLAKIPVFEIHVQRAVKAALDPTNPPRFEWPYIITEVDTVEGHDFLTRCLSHNGPFCVDIETHNPDSGKDSADMMTNRIDTIGLATEFGAIAIEWTTESKGWIFDTLKVLLEEKSLVFQNGQFDIFVLRRHGYAIRDDQYIFDTMLAACIVSPELPHDLGFLGSLEFPLERWKTNYKLGTTSRRLYNARDCVVTLELVKPLRKRLKDTHMGEELLAGLLACTKLAMRMKLFGAHVDPVKKEEYILKYKEILADQATKFTTQTKDLGEFQLGASGSHKSLHALFFDALKQQPMSYTDLGTPQLDEGFLDACQKLPEISDIATTVLNYRKAHKILSTYLEGLPIAADGCIHPTWKPHGATTGRWSSAEPNFQNIPPKVRDIFSIRESRMYIVGADFNALELREAALITKAPLLLKWFSEGVDVHTENAHLIFGGNKEKLGKVKRNCAKTTIYGVLYNSSEDVSTIYNKIKLNIPTVTYQQIAFIRKKLLFEIHQELRFWQLHQIRTAFEQKYVEEQVSGRRLYFPEGKVNINQALNFPYQALAGKIFNDAILRVDAELDWGREGIIAGVHDSIMLEGPDPDRLTDILLRYMPQILTVDGVSMNFPVEVIVGRTLGK